ncbi:lipid-A-disaccharide kinase [Alteromonadaceae bacterium 2753L.S.0a.02]|nr:lipid-A-disaccharide kinase [Alteromonadaceae bacterium 2753L.S.0a.02]
MPQATHNSSVLQSFVERRWYGRAGLLYLLSPLELLFRGVARLRKVRQIQNQASLSVPVIVVGNISVGGTGKTPVVKALVRWAQQNGYQPGVVSRGYGRESTGIKNVALQQDAAQVGDEPLEIYASTAAPVFVGENRYEAAQALLQAHPCNLIISDDGLQHYRLARDFEIIVVDAGRLFGNGHCLPVGPLREPVSRLRSVDAILLAGAESGEACGGEPQISSAKSIALESPEFAGSAPQYSYRVAPVALVNIKSGERFPLQQLHQFEELAAVAAIGQPTKFFKLLEALLPKGCLNFSKHEFPDHHNFSKSDFDGVTQKTIVMTEKDAVKCTGFATAQWWYIAIDAQLPQAFFSQVHTALR